MPFNLENIKSWVMETVKSLRDAFELGWKEPQFFTGVEPKVQTVYRNIFPTTGETFFQERPPIKSQEVSTTTPSLFPPTQEQVLSQKYEIPEPLKNVMKELVDRGLLKVKNLDRSTYLWGPILTLYFEDQDLTKLLPREKRKIPSWYRLAEWQFNHYDPFFGMDEFVENLALKLAEEGRYRTKNIPYRPDEIRAILYATIFDRLYKLSRHPKWGIDFPSLDSLRELQKDEKKRRLFLDYFHYVMWGYKLEKLEPPPLAKQLYALLMKETPGAMFFDIERDQIAQEIDEALARQAREK